MHAIARCSQLGVEALDIAGKRVLIRVDFNVPFKKVMHFHAYPAPVPLALAPHWL